MWILEVLRRKPFSLNEHQKNLLTSMSCDLPTTKEDLFSLARRLLNEPGNTQSVFELVLGTSLTDTQVTELTSFCNTKIANGSTRRDCLIQLHDQGMPKHQQYASRFMPPNHFSLSNHK